MPRPYSSHTFFGRGQNNLTGALVDLDYMISFGIIHLAFLQFYPGTMHLGIFNSISCYTYLTIVTRVPQNIFNTRKLLVWSIDQLIWQIVNVHFYKAIWLTYFSRKISSQILLTYKANILLIFIFYFEGRWSIFWVKNLAKSCGFGRKIVDEPCSRLERGTISND